MMYGHVDTPRHWVGHLNVLRDDIQDRTGGFTEFVPPPFVHQSSPPYPRERPGPARRTGDNRAVHALARDHVVRQISHPDQLGQARWSAPGDAAAGGADDLGGTLMEETISRDGWSRTARPRPSRNSSPSPRAWLNRARQRTTTYAPMPSPSRPSVRVERPEHASQSVIRASSQAWTGRIVGGVLLLAGRRERIHGYDATACRDSDAYQADRDDVRAAGPAFYGRALADDHLASPIRSTDIRAKGLSRTCR